MRHSTLLIVSVWAVAACQQPSETAETPTAPDANPPAVAATAEPDAPTPDPGVAPEAPATSGSTDASSSSPAPPEGAYSYEIKNRYPRAWAAWDAALRQTSIDAESWLADFTGTASPIRPMTAGGRAYHHGWVCKPHNCANNQVAVLIAPDQSRIVGMVRIANETSGEVTRTPVGAPNAAEAACLTRLVEGGETTVC